jgi:hypothetical protein
MFNKRKYRQELSEKTDYLTPELSGFQEPSAPKKRPCRFWIPVSAAVTLTTVAVAAVSLYAGGVFSSELSSSSGSEEGRLTTPTVEKIIESPNRSFSQTTYDSYMSFASKFTKLAFDASIATKGEESLGISIPDAYMCFALTAITSNEAAENDFLSFMGLSSEEELKTAAKEVVTSLCTLNEDDKGNLSGGYNLNSLWYNPAKVSLLAKDEELYRDLEDIFDASVYFEALTSDSGNEYLQENGLPDLPVPELKFNDSDPYAAANMSVYYCLDGYAAAAEYEAQYESATHKMDYFLDDSTKSVDYIESENKTGSIYEGDGFTGTALPINALNMSYFLPNQIETMPSTILDDVLAGSYTARTYDNDGTMTNMYDVMAKAPYFDLSNNTKLDQNALMDILPTAAGIGGVSEKMVSAFDGSLVLEEVIQQSVMKYDYNGFYSCSVTVSGEDVSYVGNYQKRDFDLSHPYLFEVSQPDVNITGKMTAIPLVIGEIVDPGYSGY